MPNIRPISVLRNNFTSVAETVHKYDEPMYLTKNGVGDMVVMSIECYEKQMAQLELYSKLAEAISEVERGAECADAESLLPGAFCAVCQRSAVAVQKGTHHRAFRLSAL